MDSEEKNDRDAGANDNSSKQRYALEKIMMEFYV